MTKVEHRFLSNAYVRFDRSTALGCSLRGIPYDRQQCVSNWNIYTNLLDEIFGKTSHYIMT